MAWLKQYILGVLAEAVEISESDNPGKSKAALRGSKAAWRAYDRLQGTGREDKANRLANKLNRDAWLAKDQGDKTSIDPTDAETVRVSSVREMNPLRRFRRN